jgi:hypothetical protein
VNLRDLVEEVLDQDVPDVEIAGQPIAEALAQLGRKTGLRFVLTPQAIAWMPYGERTRVMMLIQGIRLRDGLRRVLDGLGLRMNVAGDKIVIEPAPVLERLGRRMTIDEVQLLGKLAATPWSRLADAPIQFRADAEEDFRRVLSRVPSATALHQLEDAAENLGLVWTIDGEKIVVYSHAEDVLRRLERKVDLDYRACPLDELLVDLGRRVGVTVAFQPGVLARIQAGQRRVDLTHHETTVLQALERLAGSAGIAFEPTEAGVLVHLPSDGSSAMPRAGGGRIVAFLRIPIGDDGTALEVPFYEDNTPPEIQQLLNRRVPELLEQLRERAQR